MGGGGGGGATFMIMLKLIRYSLGGFRGMPHQNFFFDFRALRQLLVQSEAKIRIELLNMFHR